MSELVRVGRGQRREKGWAERKRWHDKNRAAPCQKHPNPSHSAHPCPCYWSAARSGAGPGQTWWGRPPPGRGRWGPAAAPPQLGRQRAQMQGFGVGGLGGTVWGGWVKAASRQGGVCWWQAGAGRRAAAPPAVRVCEAHAPVAVLLPPGTTAVLPPRRRRTDSPASFSHPPMRRPLPAHPAERAGVDHPSKSAGPAAHPRRPQRRPPPPPPTRPLAACIHTCQPCPPRHPQHSPKTPATLA